MGVRVFLRHRAFEVAGIGLLAIAGLLALSFASWSGTDPSWNHATNATVQNWMGNRGAITADLAYQIFGLAGLLLVPLAALWGWRLLTHMPPDRTRLRLLAGGVSLAVLACMASLLI